MVNKYPPALESVCNNIVRQTDPRAYRPGQKWEKYSEKWYWDMLVGVKPFRSAYADEPDSKQPLISSRIANLSQTPREKCELEGIVKEGLELAGPGQEVELHGLQARPELNGQTGRVLPTTSHGAPGKKPDAGRVPVRLAGSLQEVAVRPVNLRSPHSVTAPTPSSAPMPTAAAPTAAAPTQKPSARRTRLVQLLQEEFSLWKMGGATLTVDNLREAGMPEEHIKCCSCERSGRQADKYVGLKRTAPERSRPVPFSAVRLQCLDCFTADADDAGVKLAANAVEKYVDRHMMGAMQVCSILMGHPTMQWGGQFGSGALY